MLGSMMRDEMSKTISDVAKSAGVSTATVSRVINNDGHPVNVRTKRMVEEAIRRLGYKPSFFARGLMRATTDSVGVIVPFLSNPYHTEIVNAIVDVLARNEISVYLCCTYDKPKLEKDYIESLMVRRVDAFIVVEGPSVNFRRDQYVGLGPRPQVILVNEHVALDSPHHIVRCAQEPGLLEALGRFLETGRSRIALLRGGSVYSFELKERLFKRFIGDNGLKESDNPVFRVRRPNDPATVHEAAELIGELLRRRNGPQAVLAGNDLIAMGAVQGALAAGARVPEDLAIISVDNTIIAEVARPRLSSVDLRMKKLGHLAAHTYLELRKNGLGVGNPIRRSIDAKLVVRQTA